jgi:diaminohydroxyphosphoribosylaminopyrimidine deaminase/5-amino-6-(5-phosphoribosylamino)uracil reductase
VHEYRDTYDGILVGIGTVLADNPSLTARLPDGQGKNPVRIVVDSKARTPLDANLVTDGAALTIIAVTAKAPQERVQALKDKGVAIMVAGDGEQVDMNLLMQKLGEMEICSVFVEGGGQVNFSLLKAGLVDKVHAFIAPKLIGGREALTPVEGAGFAELTEAVELERTTVETIGQDILLTGYVKGR